jgi:two-component sensor histidine kinase/PAS domain-containing protein
MNNKSEGLKPLFLTFLSRGIGRRFAGYILLFSSIITLCITAIQLLNDYRRDINIIENHFQEIKTIYQDTLSTSIWVHNKNGLDLQLDGMMRLPTILYVRIDDELGKKIAQRGKHREQRIMKSSFELSHIHREKVVLLGQMIVYADLDEVYKALFNKLVVILISQTIKTFLVSLFILLLFYLLIGRHLYTMAEVAREVSAGSFKPMLDIGRDDELSDVASSFNDMTSKLSADKLHLEELVKIRTLKLVDEIKDHKETEAKLRSSQELLTKMGTIAKIGGWEVDLETMTPTWTGEVGTIYEVEEIPPVEEGINFYSPESRPIIQKAFEKLIAEGESYDLELQLITAKGQYKWVRTIGAPIYNETGKIIKAIGIIQDIAEDKKAKELIKSSLKEKETLLHEIHHRVKNNMTVISSLLSMQARKSHDERIKDALNESQSRVYAMSAVHETLHNSENLSEIDLQSYLSKITTSVFQTYSTDHREVNLKSDIEDSPISINQAYPTGLIINELISNSLKHAFPEKKKGEISVCMRRRDKELEMVINDDGVGIPDDFDWRNTKSMGLNLVRTLVENQLDGSIDMENQNGTKFTIKFNIET